MESHSIRHKTEEDGVAEINSLFRIGKKYDVRYVLYESKPASNVMFVYSESEVL